MADSNSEPKAPETEPESADEPGALITDLMQLVVNMNRVLFHLEKAAKDASINISLTDWILLQTLSSEGPQPMSKAVQKIGMSWQRIYQQCTPLQAAGLLSMTQMDDRSKVLEISPSGKQLALTLEKEFLRAITGEDGSLAAGPVRTARASTTKLARVMIARARVDQGS